MHKLTRQLKGLGWRRIAFSLVVLVYIGWLGLINALMFLPDWLGWLLYDVAEKISAMGHFQFIDTGDTHNLIHELVFAFIVGTAAVGLFVQLLNPFKNVAAQLIALIVWGTLIVSAAITNNWVPQPLYITFGGLTLLATVLHPKGRGLFNWFSVARVNQLLLILVIIATVPLSVFAATNINKQVTGGTSAGLFGHEIPAMHGGAETNQGLSNEQHEEEHAAQGHYRNMAALSFTIILAGLLASFRPLGWRLASWIAGLLPILFGLASMVLPNAESSLGVIWGIAAIIWGAIFIAVAEVVRPSEQVFTNNS